MTPGRRADSATRAWGISALSSWTFIVGMVVGDGLSDRVWGGVVLLAVTLFATLSFGAWMGRDSARRPAEDE